VAETFRENIEHDRVRIAILGKLRARHRVHLAVATAIEDAVGIEDLHAELALEVAQQAEHAIDRAAARLAALVDADDEEAALDEIAARGDRLAMGRPAFQKVV